MLGREKHIELVNKFHDRFDFLTKSLKESEGREDLKEYRYKLLEEKVDMIDTWSEIDDTLEDACNEIDIKELEN